MRISKIFQLFALFVFSSMFLFACSQPDSVQSQQSNQAAIDKAVDPDIEKQITKTLNKKLKQFGANTSVVSVQATELADWYWVELKNMSPMFVSKDGQYLLEGTVFAMDGDRMRNINSQIKMRGAKHEIAALNNEDLIIYPAKGETKHIIYVFTDVSCPYCQQLHQHLPEINANGIEVRYVAWPRGEQHMPAMVDIWCSPDRKKAFADVIAGQSIKKANCKNPVNAQYEMGLKIGVEGTPAIYAADGTFLGAYMDAKQLDKKLAEIQQ